ncbi:MAG: ribonucleotide reductase, partial [Xenococcaceae cyanobacterium]
MEKPLYFESMISKYLAQTGRVSSWLQNQISRLPASCTTFSVEDSMQGKDGIEDSWLFTSYGIRNAAGVAIDLSKLRPSGYDNGMGLTSSGAASFAKFYSLINQELRRGGQYKNGAVTLFL